MTDLAQSRLLRSALGPEADDPHALARERLRSSYLSFKRRATMLAGEISRSFAHLTVHDGTHLDALWEMADLAMGDSETLNPLEAYIFGGAILVHDLGLAVAAYASIARGDRSCGRGDSQSRRRSRLRRLHAIHAEKLATLAWTDDRDEQHHLIEDAELRRATGTVIGRIAHSHWGETTELAHQFDVSLGTPGWCPHHWTVDPLRPA